MYFYIKNQKAKSLKLKNIHKEVNNNDFNIIH